MLPRLLHPQSLACVHQAILFRHLSTSCCLQELQKLTRVKIVDNSKLGYRTGLKGRDAKIIHVYNHKGIGKLGDKVLVSVCGEKKHAYIVGCTQKQKPNTPRFDTNNVVLVEEGGTPTGTRIKVPIPSMLRGKEGDFTKILSLATKFV